MVTYSAHHVNSACEQRINSESEVNERESQDFDPLAPETFDSPYKLYSDLRGRCPVAHSNAWGGFWALMKYRDVRNALGDAATFITSKQNVVPKLAFTGRRPPLHLDPPEHTPYRKALNPLLRPERMAALEKPIRRFAEELIAQMVARGGGDVCEDYSSHLTIRVFAAWMNVPEEIQKTLRDVGRAYNLAVQQANGEMVKQTSLQLYDMARALIAERRKNPLDPLTDPTTALLAARTDGQPFPDEMIVGMIRQVLVVGIIAPTVIVGSIAVHLARDVALQEKLRSQPELIPQALEEFLRLYTPYRGFARTATHDVDVGGRTIREGEPIALVYASANRDADVFERPDEFILNRPNIGDHLAFGMGPHVCAGTPLARLELRIALETLLKSTRKFTLDGPIRTTLFPEIGALSVPLKFES